METTTYVDAVRADLVAAIGGDPEAGELAERLGRVLQASLHLQLLDALGEAAAELSDHLPEGHVEVRVAGRDAQLVFVAPDAPTEAPPSEDDGGTSRLTLRLPEALKTRVEAAADADRQSVNAWMVRAISTHLDRSGTTKRSGRGRGFTGYART